ncbi:MAG: SPOCS domain-containing protein [Lachnospiraceae bacterium]
MELKRKQIPMTGETGRAVSQIALDTDRNVPDNRPDMRKVVVGKGEIFTDEVKVTSDHVFLRGRLVYNVLYEAENGQLKSLKGEIPFQENLSMDGITENEQVHLQWRTEELNITMIHSRKLGIRALLTVTVLHPVTQSATLCYEVSREENERIEVKTQKIETAQLKEARFDTCRFHQDMALPEKKPNVQEILWKSIQLHHVEKLRKEGAVEISGEVLLFVLYAAEEGEVEWFEAAVPVKGEVECAGKVDSGTVTVQLRQKEASLDLKNDADGEQRNFSLDVILDAAIRSYEITQESYVADLYGLNCKTVPTYEPVVLQRILVKNYAKTKATERMHLQEPQEVHQICCCEGEVEIEKQEYMEDSVYVEGLVHVRLLYFTGDLQSPIGVQKGILTFHQKLEAPGIQPDCCIEIEDSLEQLNTVLMEKNQVEVRAVINLELLVSQPQHMTVLKEAEKQEADLEELQRIPGIVGYVAKSGEDLWKIAKEKHTTVEKLMEQNQLSEQTLSGGEKLLIVKTL